MNKHTIPDGFKNRHSIPWPMDAELLLTTNVTLLIDLRPRIGP